MKDRNKAVVLVGLDQADKQMGQELADLTVAEERRLTVEHLREYENRNGLPHTDSVTLGALVEKQNAGMRLDTDEREKQFQIVTRLAQLRVQNPGSIPTTQEIRAEAMMNLNIDNRRF